MNFVQVSALPLNAKDGTTGNQWYWFFDSGVLSLCKWYETSNWFDKLTRFFWVLKIRLCCKRICILSRIIFFEFWEENNSFIQNNFIANVDGDTKVFSFKHSIFATLLRKFLSIISSNFITLMSDEIKNFFVNAIILKN